MTHTGPILLLSQDLANAPIPSAETTARHGVLACALGLCTPGPVAQSVPRLDLAASALQPGETLTVRYDLWPSRRADRSVSVLFGAQHPKATDPDQSASDRTDALRMCLPGFSVEPAEAAPLPRQLTRLTPDQSRLPLGTGPFDSQATPLGTPARRGMAPTALCLPAFPAVEINVTRLIQALIATGRRAVLVADLTQVAIGRLDLIALSRAEAALRSRAMAVAPEGLEAMRILHQLALLALWKERRLGTAVSFALAVEHKASSPLADIAAALLFGRPGDRGPRPVDDGATGLDLSLAFPSPGLPPGILPAAADLGAMGFFARHDWRDTGLPADQACRIGTLANGTPVRLGPETLGRHLYLIGATGVGKSTQMAGMIRQDIARGLGTIVIDPHGDLVGDVLSGLGLRDRPRTQFADLSASDGGFGLDLLRMPAEHRETRLNFVCNQLIAIFKTVLYRDQPEGFGPMFEAYFRNALMLLVLGSTGPCSLVDFDRVFGDTAYRSQLLAACPDETVVRFWKQTAVRAGGEAALENVAPYIVSKMTQFSGSPLIRPIIDGTRPAIDLGQVFGGNGVLLVNLAKGAVGEMDAALIGALFSIEIFAAALARSAVPKPQRRRVRLYMDEFQTYGTDVLAQMLAECRKFGLELALANQSLDQITETRGRPGIAEAILANVGTVMAFRTGPRDARLLEDWFKPGFCAPDLMRLRDHEFVTRQIQDGCPIEPMKVCGLGLPHDPVTGPHL